MIYCLLKIHELEQKPSLKDEMNDSRTLLLC